jgi:hypothetical protein
MTAALSATGSRFLAAASTAVTLLEHPDVEARWSEPSVLAELTVGGLAAHLARQVLLVEAYLDAPEPHSAEPVSAEAYYAVLTGTSDLSSQLNVGVRERSHAGAVAGARQVAAHVRDCLRRLTNRLGSEPPNRQVLAYGGQAMRLREYMRSRLVELAVHNEDLALSIGVEPPETGVSDAVDVLVGAARLRHGDAAVLRALARRERDDVEALRVL